MNRKTKRQATTNHTINDVEEYGKSLNTKTRTMFSTKRKNVAVRIFSGNVALESEEEPTYLMCSLHNQ